MARMEVRIVDLPDVLAMLRAELAKLLREEAETQGVPHTARTLRELAAIFESGVSRQDRRL